MKTTIYFIGTCFISTGAFMAALNLKNPFPAFGVAFGIWALFIWGYMRRSKKAAAKERQEQFFQNHMRVQYRNQQR
jgi:hypothetical protein